MGITVATLLILVFLVAWMERPAFLLPWKQTTPPGLGERAVPEAAPPVRTENQARSAPAPRILADGEKETIRMAATHTPEPLPRQVPLKPAASAEKPLRALEPPLEAQASMPPFLGEIAIGRNETLGAMIHKIYGVFNPLYLDKVIRANPQLANPDLIEPGEKIRFPSIALGVDPSKLSLWWVEILREKNLVAAYRFLRFYPAGFPPIHLVPFWNRLEGMTFAIVQKRYFAREEAAQESLHRLPAEFNLTARVMAGWRKETVFFANPTFYLSGDGASRHPAQARAEKAGFDWEMTGMRGDR